jgi:hypothetical protein
MEWHLFAARHNLDRRTLMLTLSKRLRCKKAEGTGDAGAVEWQDNSVH